MTNVKTIFKRAITAVTLLSVLATAPACTNRELVAAGAGLLVGAVVGIAIDRAMTREHYHRLPPMPPRFPHYSRCQRYYSEGWTIRQTPWGPYIVDGHRSYQVYCSSTQEDPTAEVSTISPEMVADALETDAETAKKVLNALELGQNGDASGLAELGLTQDDFLAFARFQMPSDAAVEALSGYLNQTKETTSRVLERLINKAREQKQERDEADKTAI